MSTAITYDHFGGPDVLTVTDVEPVAPGAGQVQIQVRAAGVNLVDAKLRRGDLAHLFAPRFPVIPGIEIAGEISALGTETSGFTLGQAVFGVADAGGYTEFAVATQIHAKPESMSWELAAALPIVGEAAFRTLGHLNVQSGERLLIHGGAGSVGTLATQLAVARGVTVIATASPDDQDAIERRGATAVAYGDGWAQRVRGAAPNGVDAVLDAAGAGVLSESIDLAGGRERIITIADEAAFSLGVRFTGPDPNDRDRTALAKLASLIAAGELELPIWRTYMLTDASHAHEDLEAHRNKGKIVLRP